MPLQFPPETYCKIRSTAAHAAVCLFNSSAFGLLAVFPRREAIFPRGILLPHFPLSPPRQVLALCGDDNFSPLASLACRSQGLFYTPQRPSLSFKFLFCFCFFSSFQKALFVPPSRGPELNPTFSKRCGGVECSMATASLVRMVQTLWAWKSLIPGISQQKTLA